jgi:hypothetical protein
VKHLKIMGLALVAVIASAAFAASSAMALPEWGKCEAKAGGKYADSNCTIKASKSAPGSFEWKKGSQLPNERFTGGSVGSGGVLSVNLRGCDSGKYESTRVSKKKCEEGAGEWSEENGSTKVECESEQNSGEATGKKGLANVESTFSGCKLFGTIPCGNIAEGEVKVNTLKGELGYINKAEHKVGVLLTPVTKKGRFVTFECGGFLKNVVGVGNTKEGAAYSPESSGGYDGIISPITPVNQMTSSYEQVFTVKYPADENIPSKFEGKHIELLESYAEQTENLSTSGWSTAGEELTNVNHPETAGEIKG